MAGTLTIGTISDGTNSTSSTNAIMGSAKAWVNFNGVTTATIRASYNVSSVTRNATGDYTVNFTTPLVDANYAVSGGIGYFGQTAFFAISNTVAPTASAFRFYTLTTAAVGADQSITSISVFR